MDAFTANAHQSSKIAHTVAQCFMVTKYKHPKPPYSTIPLCLPG